MCRDDMQPTVWPHPSSRNVILIHRHWPKRISGRVIVATITVVISRRINVDILLLNYVVLGFYRVGPKYHKKN